MSGADAVRIVALVMAGLVVGPLAALALNVRQGRSVRPRAGYWWRFGAGVVLIGAVAADASISRLHQPLTWRAIALGAGSALCLWGLRMVTVE